MRLTVVFTFNNCLNLPIIFINLKSASKVNIKEDKHPLFHNRFIKIFYIQFKINSYTGVKHQKLERPR
jgi:hypothetical protein